MSGRIGGLLSIARSLGAGAIEVAPALSSREGSMLTKAEGRRRARHRTAHHEAAHALVGTLESGSFVHVTIVPDGDSLGRHRSTDWRDPATFASVVGTNAPRDRYFRWMLAEQFNARIRLNLAGVIAENIADPDDPIDLWEWIWDGDSYGSNDTDAKAALAWARGRFAHYQHERRRDRRAAAEIEAQWNLLDEWMRRPPVWKCIEAIATALLKRGTLKPGAFYRVLDAHPDVGLTVATPPAWVKAEAERRQWP